MSTTIESLELQVQSSATSAVGGIDALASSLGKLKNATKGGVGLTAVAKQLTTLNSALNGVSGANADNLNKLAQGLQTLSSCGNLKLSSSVAAQITNIGNAVKSLNGSNFSVLSDLANALAPLSSVGKANLNSFISQLNRLPQAIQSLNSVDTGSLRTRLQELTSAFEPMTQMGKNNLTSFVTQLKKLPEAVTALQSVNIGQLASQIQQLADAFKPLATEMQSIANGFSALPTRLQRLIQQTNNLSNSNNKAANSYVNFAAKIGIAVVALKRIASVVASWIVQSNKYVEDLNLFTAAMGDYADEAKRYAENVAEIMGIDPAEWLRNQGIFMTITKGFGVMSERAYIMSKNLTQLGYDISSFYNISFQDAMQKLSSGISGELEPLRRLGYDLSVARLQQEAYTLGITKSVNAMTQAEKAELRYYAIMTQVTTAQGDMARTLTAPANQIRILQAQVTQCARALGNIFIPALNAVLPYAIALAKVIRILANAIASLFGFALPEIDYSGVGGGLSGIGAGAEEAADGMGGAAKKAKELKNALLGIDELNVISEPDDSGGGGGLGNIGGGGGLGFELPEYDFLGEAINQKVDEIVQKMKDWLGLTEEVDTWAELFDTRLGRILHTVATIGASFATWKIASGVAAFIDKITKLDGSSTGLGFLLLLADSMSHLVDCVQDIIENGADFDNVSGIITEFSTGLGAALIALGNVKTGSAFLVLGGIGNIVREIAEIAKTGEIDWDNINGIIRGLGTITIALGVLKSNAAMLGTGFTLIGVTTALGELKKAQDEAGNIQWDKVDWVTFGIGAAETIFGIVKVVSYFNTARTALAPAATVAEAGQAMSTATEAMSTSTATLSPKLTSLAKNIGMGILILAEVAAGAIIFAGAIAVVGLELSAVAEAWQPVIDNAGTVAIAVGIGTALLAAIGLATYALGTAGTAVALNIAIGTAILLELGVATALFILEIWAIGKGLDEIGLAWQPVLDNGETIATGIGLGTALLIGIGVVTAALGVATVASAGLLPLAIGLGTALLVELAAATILFIESLVAVSTELSENLSPALDGLNEKLPDLTTDLSDFVDFMTLFAGEVVRYTQASTVSGLSATIDTIIGWFTTDPLDKLSKDIEKISGQATTLNEKLNIANPELETAKTLLGNYAGFVEELGTIAGSGGTVNLSEGLKTNLNTVGQNIVTGFNDGVKSKYSLVQTTITNWGTDVQKWFNNSSFGGVNKEKFATYATDIINGFKDKISSSYSSSKSSITTWATNVKNWFTQSSFGGVNKEKFENYAKDIVDGFKNKITAYSSTSKTSITTWASNIKSWFEGSVSYSTFYDIAEDVIDGFNDGINKFYTTTKPYMEKWARAAKAAYKAELDSNSPSKVFMRIGEDTVLGYNLGIMSLAKTTANVVSDWANSFTSVSPVMSFAVDTSALRYYDSDSFAKSVSANVSARSEYTVDNSFSVEGMKEAVMQALRDTGLVDDVRRQADKHEQTVVQIGNRTVSDAVITQQKANGYVFAR